MFLSSINSYLRTKFKFKTQQGKFVKLDWHPSPSVPQWKSPKVSLLTDLLPSSELLSFLFSSKSCWKSSKKLMCIELLLLRIFISSCVFFLRLPFSLSRFFFFFLLLSPSSSLISLSLFSFVDVLLHFSEIFFLLWFGLHFEPFFFRNHEFFLFLSR